MKVNDIDSISEHTIKLARDFYLNFVENACKWDAGWAGLLGEDDTKVPILIISSKIFRFILEHDDNTSINTKVEVLKSLTTTKGYNDIFEYSNMAPGHVKKNNKWVFISKARLVNILHSYKYLLEAVTGNSSDFNPYDFKIKDSHMDILMPAPGDKNKSSEALQEGSQDKDRDLDEEHYAKTRLLDNEVRIFKARGL